MQRIDKRETTTPTQDPAQASTTAKDPEPRRGLGVLAGLMRAQPGRPDPAAVAAALVAYPQDRPDMVRLLQTTLGNGYVQQVIALVPKPPGVQQQDGGVLGKSVAVDSATASAKVELPDPAEAVVTSCDADLRPTFSVEMTIPLAQLASAGATAGITAADLALITDVTLSVGAATGGLTFRPVDGGLSIELAGLPAASAVNVSLFKVVLASGGTILVSAHASQFHTDIAEYKRADLRQTIRGRELFIAQRTASDEAPVPCAPTHRSSISAPVPGHPVGTVTVPGAAPAPASTGAPASAPPAMCPSPSSPDADSYIQNERQWLALDQAQLAAISGPVYVTLDEHGNAVAAPQPAAPAAPAKLPE